jgi:hypothetical protein
MAKRSGAFNAAQRISTVQNNSNFFWRLRHYAFTRQYPRNNGMLEYWNVDIEAFSHHSKVPMTIANTMCFRNEDLAHICSWFLDKYDNALHQKEK